MRDLKYRLLRVSEIWVDPVGGLHTEAGFDAKACDLVFQGDFGKGIPTGSGVFQQPGCNPYTLYGPVAAGATSVDAFVTGGGSLAIPQIQFRLGQVVSGDLETEWVFVRLSVTATTDLLPGQVWQIDENYTAILATTSGKVLNANVGVSYIFAPATLTGTYYGWLARSGHVIVQAAGSSIATGMAETTSTGGQVKFLNSHTAGSMTIGPFAAYGASSNITFKADTVSGSPYLQNLASQISVNGVTGGLTDIMPGAVITGTGMPSNAIIAGFDNKGPGGTPRALIGTNTTGAMNTAQNATATGTQVTLTVTNMVQALMLWPSETTQN